jgi:CspA family cold shock protein
MRTAGFKLAFMFVAMLFLYSCGKSTDVVESGTYQGTVDKVEAEKSEIYVETGDGKRLELYFTDSTELTQQGNPATFDVLKEGQKVEVTVEKVGQRLDPLRVNIME